MYIRDENPAITVVTFKNVVMVTKKEKQHIQYTKASKTTYIEAKVRIKTNSDQLILNILYYIHYHKNYQMAGDYFERHRELKNSIINEKQRFNGENNKPKHQSS